MISDLISDGKIVFYTTDLSCKFISCHIADLLVSEGHWWMTCFLMWSLHGHDLEHFVHLPSM